jgi:phage gpG-like protein
MIDIELVGLDVVAEKLAKTQENVKKELRATVFRLAVMLAAKVKSEKLSGQVLKVRTGTLRRSIHAQTFETTDSIYATVGTNVAYGGVHEYGWTGAQMVRAHLRQIKQAFGKAITPTTVAVASHTRKVSFPARSFLRSAFAEFEGEINNEIANAVVRGLAK